jgi:hypothetical protein
VAYRVIGRSGHRVIDKQLTAEYAEIAERNEDGLPGMLRDFR